jgi:hypothetical protein
MLEEMEWAVAGRGAGKGKEKACKPGGELQVLSLLALQVPKHKY